MKIAPMTAPEAGKFLREVAETTARASMNWGNFESIATQLIKSAYDGGQETAYRDIVGAISPLRADDLGAIRNQAQAAIDAIAAKAPTQ